VCGKKENLNVCTGCRNVYYCAQEHQKVDWNKHKALCKSVKLSAEKGFIKSVEKEGDGKSFPTKGNRVMVHYVGKLVSGSQFDSSRDRGEPFSFVLGGEVIKGWNESVATMSKGEISTVVISPEYGYGKHGYPPDIPANATLVFNIELISFE